LQAEFDEAGGETGDRVVQLAIVQRKLAVGQRRRQRVALGGKSNQFGKEVGVAHLEIRPTMTKASIA
jgi:hypothetical protein